MEKEIILSGLEDLPHMSDEEMTTCKCGIIHETKSWYCDTCDIGVASIEE